MSDGFLNIIGHKKQCQYLRNVLKSGQSAQAYCFSGPKHVGKFTIAKICAAEILKISQEALIINSNISIIDTEDLISIDDIRKIRERLALSAFGNDFKIAIINNADTMSIAAQNALLKTLEEPEGKTVLFLITSQPEKLLLTILSRCAHIRFGLVGETQTGRPGIDFLLQDTDYKKRYLLMKNEAEKFLSLPLSGRFGWIETLVKQKDERSGKIEMFLSFWQERLHKQFIDAASVQNGHLSQKYAKSLNALLQTQSAIEQNSNLSLALQHFALLSL